MVAVSGTNCHDAGTEPFGEREGGVTGGEDHPVTLRYCVRFLSSFTDGQRSCSRLKSLCVGSDARVAAGKVSWVYGQETDIQPRNDDSEGFRDGGQPAHLHAPILSDE